MPKGNLAELVERAAEQAISQQDLQWITNLASLLDPAGITARDFQDEETARLLLKEAQAEL